MSTMCVRCLGCAAAVVAGAGVVNSAALAGVDSYGAPYRSIELPPVGDGSFGVSGAALADGRLVTVTGDSLLVETGAGSGAFRVGATIESSLIGGSVDPSFLTVSPNGSRIALGAGAGKPVLVFDASLATSGGVIGAGDVSVFDVAHFSAAWRNDSELAISAGAFGSPGYVSLLDTTSDPMAPVNPTIISNVGGASAGVAFDAQGRLYTGNGFDLGPGGSETGWIKAFEPGDWAGGAADFEAEGAFIGDVLSAGSLVFDGAGNLFVGGGDFDEGETGYLAGLSASAVADALAGVGPVDLSEITRLDPRGDGAGFYGAAFNSATGEVYVTDTATWYATVPAPGAGVAMVLAGGIAWRRRRDS